MLQFGSVRVLRLLLAVQFHFGSVLPRMWVLVRFVWFEIGLIPISSLNSFFPFSFLIILALCIL